MKKVKPVLHLFFCISKIISLNCEFFEFSMVEEFRSMVRNQFAEKR